MMQRPRLLVVLALLGIGAVAMPVLAQEPHTQDQRALPQATTATYRDWTLRCDHLAEDPPRQVCEVAQAVRAADDQAVLAQVVLGKLSPDDAIRLIVQLPAGVWLPANVTLTVSTGESTAAIYTRCQHLCIADTDTDRTFIEALKHARDPATLTFQDANRRTIELPVSLDGFTSAIIQMDQAVSP